MNTLAVMEMKGKTALVTGGASRIGKAISHLLAQKGAKVVTHYYQQPEPNTTACSFQADFSNPQAIQKLVEEVEERLGPIQILVNNAAVFEKTPFFEISEENWDRHLDINLKAPFLLAQAVSKKMFDLKEGCIINISDATFEKPHKGSLPYNVSKAGLTALTKAMAKELAPHVLVNAISLGPILPPDYYTPKQKEAAAKKTLLKRWGDPQEVAKAVCFLIEEARFATGSTFLLDGGRLLA